MREAERDNVYNEYKDRKGELITGIVRRFERGNIIVDLGRAEAVLPVREQVPRESYRAGDRIVAYVLDIDRKARAARRSSCRARTRACSRSCSRWRSPEIYEKIVRIEASAREPGARAKIAVSSRDRDVDPVGACVGMKGSRVQAVVQELRGEKIDIVPFDDDPARFVCNAIAPAEVSRVIIDAEGAPHGADRPRRQALAGDRQEGPERAPRVAAHRLAHRHPLREPRSGRWRRAPRPRWPPSMGWGRAGRRAVQDGLPFGQRGGPGQRRRAGHRAGVGSAEAANQLLAAAGRRRDRGAPPGRGARAGHGRGRSDGAGARFRGPGAAPLAPEGHV